MTEPNLVVYLSQKQGITFSACSQIDIMGCYLDFYIESGVETVPKEGFDDMKKLISFCGAAAAFMPSDGIFGATVSLPGRERKYFCAFDMAERTFVARSHKWLPREYDSSPRIAVQKISQSQNINSVSMVDIEAQTEEGKLINRLIERYLEVNGEGEYRAFESSDQYVVVKDSSGFKEDIDSVCADLLSDFSEMAEISEIKKKHSFKFSCGCDKSRVSSVFSVLSSNDLDYLFNEGGKIEVECPRCGFKYILKRGEIETG
jgi:hypothetical protein